MQTNLGIGAHNNNFFHPFSLGTMFVPFSAFTQLVFAITPLHYTRPESAALAATEPHNVSIVCARESFLFPHSSATCTFLCDASSHAFTLWFLFHIVDLLFLHTPQSILQHTRVCRLLPYCTSNQTIRSPVCALVTVFFFVPLHRALDECAMIFLPTLSVRIIDVTNSSSSSFFLLNFSTIVDRKDDLKL